MKWIDLAKEKGMKYEQDIFKSLPNTALIKALPSYIKKKKKRSSYLPRASMALMIFKDTHDCSCRCRSTRRHVGKALSLTLYTQIKHKVRHRLRSSQFMFFSTFAVQDNNNIEVFLPFATWLTRKKRRGKIWMWMQWWQSTWNLW